MSKVARDENGAPLARDVLGGRCKIYMFEGRPTSWYFKYRVNNKAKGSKYIVRCLDELDEKRAILKAEDLYLAFQGDIDEEGVPVRRYKVVDLIKEWILLNEERNRAGSMALTTLRAKVSSLQNAGILFITKEKKITYVDQIKRDTFESFSRWRKNEGFKLIPNSRGKTIIPKDSTVKRDIVHLAEWFKYLNDKEYIDLKPTFEIIKQRKDELDANPPIPLDQWGHVHRYLKQWSDEAVKEETKTNNWRRNHYWRELFRTLILVLYNTGARPSELVGKEEKIREAQSDGSYVIKRVLKGGLRWEDIEIQDSFNMNAATGKYIDIVITNLFIRYSKTGETRDIPCNCTEFLSRWRRHVNEYRRQVGLRKVTPKDYVFFNPHTDKPYPYSQFSLAWSDLRTNLSLVLSPVRSDKKYTLYSLRSSYITNQIDEGKDIYLIKKITGHSLEMLQRHYDRSDVRKRTAEAVSRTIGKKKEKKVVMSLENVDDWDKLALDGTKISDKPKKQPKESKKKSNPLKIQ